jgi:hypothetical protein
MRGSSVRRRRESEGGYALLMVFLMAAIVALMLYQQLPRVAFESERDKEQLLIDRGEQYTRAIQLYYLANNRQYPTSLDDLEKREKRFLRRRYKDPYTGKDEWRIIHTTGGFLTDSLVQKPPGAGDSQSQSASNTTNNTNSADQQPQVNAAVLQRPSDRPVTPSGGFAQPFAQQDPNAQPNTIQNNGPLPPITLQPQQGPGALPPITLQPGGGNQPGGLPPITLAPAGTQGGQQVTGQIPGQNPGQPGQLRIPQLVPGQNPVSPFPGQPSPGGLPGGIQTGLPTGFQIDPSGQLVPAAPVPGQSPGQGLPGQPQGIPGQPFSPQPVQPLIPNQLTPVQNQQFQQFENQQLQNQPGGTPGSPNAALNLINQLLTSPRQSTSTPIATGGNQVGGIAGVASTYTGPSIKVYKDQDQYQLWEFVFTPTASIVPGGANPGTGIPGNGPGRGGANQPGGLGGFGSGGGRGGPGQPGGIFQTAPPGR